MSSNLGKLIDKKKLQRKPKMSNRGQPAAGGSGGAAGPQRQDPVLYTPPNRRPQNVTQEQKQETLAYINTLRERFDYELDHEILFYLKSISLTMPAEEVTPEWWIRLSGELHDEQGRHDARQEVGRNPFIEQLFHLLDMAGLSTRSWNMMIGTVIFDDSEENKEKIAKMIFAARYKGFDTSVIIKRVIRSWREAKDAPRSEVRLTYDGPQGAQEWIYTNHESFIDDITLLILIFLNRGAVVSKILKKSARDFTSLLRLLINKYSLRSGEEAAARRRAEALGPEVVTLPRIAACFAQLTTNLYVQGFGRPIVDFSEFGECPHALFSPMFPSVVRKGYLENNIMQNIHPQLILVAIKIDNVLHTRNRVTPLDQIWTYYLAAHNSNVLLDEARVEQSNRFLVTIDGRFNETITGLRQHCSNRIREMRPHERMADFIREMDELP